MPLAQLQETLRAARRQWQQGTWSAVRFGQPYASVGLTETFYSFVRSRQAYLKLYDKDGDGETTKEARPATRSFRASVCAACTLNANDQSVWRALFNAKDQSRVTLSHASAAAHRPRQEGRAPVIRAKNDARSQEMKCALDGCVTPKVQHDEN